MGGQSRLLRISPTAPRLSRLPRTRFFFVILAMVALWLLDDPQTLLASSAPWSLSLENSLVATGDGSSLPWHGPTYRLGLTARQLGSTEQLTLGYDHISALTTGEARDTLSLRYTYRQMLLLFGYVRFDSALALQLAPYHAGQAGAQFQLNGEAVVGNLGAFFRLGYRSKSFIDLLSQPAPDLFPAWPVSSSYVGTVAETEFRSRLDNRTTWVGNISWRWPESDSPQIGLAFGPEFRLGESGRVTGKIGLRSVGKEARGVLALSTRFSPAPAFLLRLDATADTSGQLDWTGGVGFDLDLPGFRGTASLTAVQRPGDRSATLGTTLTASVLPFNTEFALQYQLDGTKALSLTYHF